MQLDDVTSDIIVMRLAYISQLHSQKNVTVTDSVVWLAAEDRKTL